MKWIKSGAPWVWLTAGAVSISLLAVLGLLLLLGWKGLSFFWPATLHQFELETNGKPVFVLGEIYEREDIAPHQLGLPESDEEYERLLIKTANRDVSESDFVSVLTVNVMSTEIPHDVAVIERSRNGDFFGYPVALMNDGEQVPVSSLPLLLDAAVMVREQIRQLEKNEIGSINWSLEQIRLQERKLQIAGELSSEEVTRFEQQREELQAQYAELASQLEIKRELITRDILLVEDAMGVEYALPMSEVLDVWFPNKMSRWEKLVHWKQQVVKFVSDEPREANTEGGVFPAIFGTVLMVLLMSVIVTPLGVIAAIYLNEYAGNNVFTRLIRIAIINLAGVPSIVYGVFGLGFFVYMLGGSIDNLFYAESLPAPTFGAPGILWSALTLAILTLPVVIVSTEEGLSRVPHTVREGSLALGATQFETLWRIVLPMASPAIMTGLILAVARAAGEVAPLMLVGVVKMAPTLPIDMNFPYLHLDRKFMHLGYHIYDVGFQSPNIEAARPLVYATSFLLVLVIVSLNLTAIGIRNHLRDKFRSLEQ